ncbi:MAG: acetyltransferase [Candidatus Competibacteraceae bacterium]
MPPELRPLAEAVRDACVQAALSAYEDAGIKGLCAEGRWECAIGAIQGIDLEAVLSAVPLSRERPIAAEVNGARAD